MTRWTDLDPQYEALWRHRRTIIGASLVLIVIGVVLMALVNPGFAPGIVALVFGLIGALALPIIRVGRWTQRDQGFDEPSRRRPDS